MSKEYRISYKRDNGSFSHLRHKVFKREETARKWFKFFSEQTKDKRKGLWLNNTDRDAWYYDYPITPIILGPRLQVREVGDWEDLE